MRWFLPILALPHMALLSVGAIAQQDGKHVRVLSEGAVLLESRRAVPALETKRPSGEFSVLLQDRMLAPEAFTSATPLPLLESKSVSVSKWSIEGNNVVESPSGASRVLQVKAGDVSIAIGKDVHKLSEGQALTVSSDKSARISTGNDTAIVEITEVK